MTVLNCVKPGAKAGQTILFVDLTMAGDVDATLSKLNSMQYSPEIRHVSYKTGVHVIAVVRDEQNDPIPEDHLIDEWMRLRSEFDSDAVHLWRGSSV